MSSNYGAGGYTRIFTEEDSVPAHEEQPPAVSVRVCLHGICYGIKSLQLLILPSNWETPFTPVAQLAVPIRLPPALALTSTNGKLKQQNINFIPEKFLLFNLWLSSQALCYRYHFLRLTCCSDASALFNILQHWGFWLSPFYITFASPVVSSTG